MEIGLYDVPDQAQLESHPVAADGYDEYIRGAQEAEHMGCQYYFSIERQTSDVRSSALPTCTSPHWPAPPAPRVSAS